jgi:predicted Zn-ribbon and HTH transcriptional regulator
MLMRYSLLSRANKLLAMSNLRFCAAVGLSTGQTNLTAHLYKLTYRTARCWPCGYYKEDSVHIVCDCPVLACKRYIILGCMFLKPEDLENVRVSSLLSLVANTWLGLLGSVMETLS